MTKYLMFVALVAGFWKTIWTVDPNCDYRQHLLPGVTHYVFNPGFPKSYSGANMCRWYTTSDTNIKLSCRNISLPATSNCIGDRLYVSPSGDFRLSDARIYHGTEPFNVTSDAHEMYIMFVSIGGSDGGQGPRRFVCELEAVDREPETPGLTCECGWKKQTRIVGGTETGVNEYPMMAGLVNLPQRLLYCGGTIISPKHVLSAAHCLRNIFVKELGILVGEHNTTTGNDTNATSIHLVSGFSIHPLYRKDENDIAVITVKDTIVFTMEVGPACLPFQHASAEFVGTKVTALGWGTLEFAGATSPTLQKVQLDVTPITRCQRTFPNVKNNQLCTYTPGKDACQFDSGGPLLWQNPSSMRLVLAGVISYGKTCADEDPGVGTRVGAYMNWILSNTPGANYCRAE